MKIEVLFFGITSDITGVDATFVEIESRSCVQDLKKQLIACYPNLKHINEFAIAVNETYADDELLLTENDVVAVIPPVSGG